MATRANAPIAGEIWHLSIEDLFAPVREPKRLGGDGPFVINLSGSTAPIDLPKRPFDVCPDAHIYLIEATEDGRIYYRLRLGSFVFEDDADALLQAVRDIYPAAVTTAACTQDISHIESMQAEDDARRALAVNTAKAAAERAAAERAAAVNAAAGIAAQRLAVQRVAAEKAAQRLATEKAAAQMAAEKLTAEKGAAEKATAERAAAKNLAAQKAAAQADAEMAAKKLAAEMLAAERLAAAKAATETAAEKQFAIEKAAVEMAAQRLAARELTAGTSIEFASPLASTITATSFSKRALPVMTEPSYELKTAPPVLTDMVKLGPKRSATKIGSSAREISRPPASASSTVALPSTVGATTVPSPREVKKLNNSLPDLETTRTVRALTQPELEDQESSRWFVIELAVADHEFDPAAVPHLDIFDEYRLYSVAGFDQGRSVHALRLGFFTQEIAAITVASYLGAFYNMPAIRRVSVAERGRFTDQRIEARKATGTHAVIEITDELVVRRKRVAQLAMTDTPAFIGQSRSVPPR